MRYQSWKRRYRQSKAAHEATVSESAWIPVIPPTNDDSSQEADAPKLRLTWLPAAKPLPSKPMETPEGKVDTADVELERQQVEITQVPVWEYKISYFCKSNLH